MKTLKKLNRDAILMDYLILSILSLTFGMMAAVSI